MKQDELENKEYASKDENQVQECEEVLDEVIASLGANH